jgi:HEAT repeat protein
MTLATSTQSRFNCDQEEFDDVINRLVNARLLHRWELEGKICYEMAHEYLIAEIGQWIDQDELAFKQVDELLTRELITWRVHGILIPAERLALLLPQRDKLKDADHEARYLFYLSALHHRTTEVSLWAIDALGQLGDSRAIEPLISILNKNYGAARSNAAKALGQIGPAAVPHLLAILGDENVHMRSGAAEALAAIGEPATEPLIDALSSPDVSVRISAAKTLSNMEYRRAVEPLITALNEADVIVRYLAAGALGRLRDKRAVGPLIQSLNDVDWRVRDRAAKALGMVDDSRVVAPLVAQLGDVDARVRQRTLLALENQKEAAVSPLIEALKDEDPQLRRGAAAALGSRGSNEAILPLKNALHDTDEEVRRNAAESLGRLEYLRVDLLIGDLKDEDWEVRRQAAIALGELRDVESIQPLIKTLTDNDWRVRMAAAISLGYFGEQALNPLKFAIKSNDSIINKSLAFTLRMIGTPDAVALMKTIGFEELTNPFPAHNQ